MGQLVLLHVGLVDEIGKFVRTHTKDLGHGHGGDGEYLKRELNTHDHDEF
jgi:hypothetical protein